MLNPCCTGRTLRLCSLFLLLPVLPGRPIFASDSASRTHGADPLPATAATLSGTVIDPTGAKIPNATIHIETAHTSTPGIVRDVKSGADGRYSISLPAGTYDVTILAPGFDPFISTIMVGARSLTASLDARLAIATEAQTVTVAADTQQASTASTDNKSALNFKKTDLDAFSSDDDTFQNQLLALAGAGDPQNPPQIFVDGFSNGRFPPKSSIREIRINSNPYSAQYAGPGYTRVEIFTKPGGDGYHGTVSMAGNDDVFNSTNPFAGAEPPYHLLIFDSNVNGPLGKKTSFFLGAQYRDQQNNAVVNATTGGTTTAPVFTVQAVPAPQVQQTYSARIDRQLTPNNTFSGRFEFNQLKLTNSGVGALVLASQGVNSTANTDTLQVADTQVIGTKTIVETRFQYAHATVAQNSASTAAAIIVQGDFSGGGSPTQTTYDDQNRGELNEYISHQQGAHFLRIGGRYRFTHDVNSSQNDFNGTFIYPSLAAYEQTGNIGATEFTLTQGQPTATIFLSDFDVYAEDEWKVRSNLTLDLGFRFEAQDAIADHADPAPRVGLAWAIGQTDKRAASVTLRTGGGLFYDRFDVSNLVTTLHQNGIAETSYVVQNPAFFCGTVSIANGCPPASSLTTQAPTIYRESPHLHAEYTAVAGISAERQLGKIGSITLNYNFQRGIHQYQSANVNAPLPGTYVYPVAGSGTRPFGGTQNIYEFQSNGISNTNRVFANLNLNPTKHLFFWLFAVARDQHTDASGAASFVSDSYNVAADYGRPAFPGKRLYTGGNLDLPHGFDLNYFVGATSGTPFNITTGTDLNGDDQYNDRPAFLTAKTANSVVYNTRFGSFDANPQPGEAIIPINYGTGPAFADLDVGAGKSFKFGPRPAAAAPDPGAPKGPVSLPDPRYSVRLTLDAENVLNHVNGGPPVGVLSSADFGNSNSLNSPFSSNTAANRLILVRAAFNF